MGGLLLLMKLESLPFDLNSAGDRPGKHNSGLRVIA